MITKWLHLADFGGDPWMLPILTAMNEAVARGAIPSRPKGLSELPLYLGTRLTMLPCVSRRVVAEWRQVCQAAQEHGPDNVFTCGGKRAYALNIDRDLTHCLLVDVETLLFELKACTDLIDQLIRLVHDHVGEHLPRRAKESALQTLLVNLGQDISWHQSLTDRRNFFAHRGCAYLAIDISSDCWDLIVMQRNLDKFDDPKMFITGAELGQMQRGFEQARCAIQNHIIELYRRRRPA